MTCSFWSQHGFPVIMMGDWNEPPPSKSDDFLLWYVQEEGQPVASRWDGDRCVDYLQTTRSVECLNLTYRDESFSDHKKLQGTFTAACNVDPAMRMIGARSFLPGNVSLNGWTTTLEKAWEHVRVPRVNRNGWSSIKWQKQQLCVRWKV